MLDCSPIQRERELGLDRRVSNYLAFWETIYTHAPLLLGDRLVLSYQLTLVKRNDIKYERNDIIALLAKALLEQAVSRNYVRGC